MNIKDPGSARIEDQVTMNIKDRGSESVRIEDEITMNIKDREDKNRWGLGIAVTLKSKIDED